jgi:hypothetical protein
MTEKKKTRHFHAGKHRKTMGSGDELVEVAESSGRLFVSSSGMFLNTRPGTATEGSLERDGYRRISVGGKRAPAARVVYEVFVEEIPDGMEIDHINTVRDDNRVENLRVVTHRDNLLNPLTRPRRRIACSANGAKGAAAQDRNILLKNLSLGSVSRRLPVVAYRPLFEEIVFGSAKEASEKTGLSMQAICHALKGRSKTCGGYVWTYATEGK